MASATGLRDAESIIFNRGRSVASWTFTGRVFHPAQRPVFLYSIQDKRLTVATSPTLIPIGSSSNIKLSVSAALKPGGS